MNRSHRLGLLRRTTFYGSFITLVVLGAASCGDVKSLGENRADAGEGGSNGDMNAGGEPGSGSGGKVGETPAGGGHDGGGLGVEGGQGGRGIDPGPLPYPLYPTLPISADCSCDDDDLVCNAADECVPRCEPGGVCAMWRVDGAVLSWLTSEDVVYFVTPGQLDDLGEPLPGEAGQNTLWTFNETSSAPTKLAAVAGRNHGLLAHFSGKTYVGTYIEDVQTVIAVDDDGTVAERALPDSAVHFTVSRDGVFTIAFDGSIDRLTLSPDGSFGAAFENVVPGAAHEDPFPHVDVLASDRLWREHANTLCSFDLANLQAAGTCVNSYSDGPWGAKGSRIVYHSSLTEGVNEFDMDTQMTRVLWSPKNDFFAFSGTMAGGFITGWMVQYPDPGGSMLARFPTEGVAMDPLPLISQQVVRAIVEVSGDAGGFSTQTSPAVTSDAVYWTQWFDDADAARYIFRAPLP